MLYTWLPHPTRHIFIDQSDGENATMVEDLEGKEVSSENTYDS